MTRTLPVLRLGRKNRFEKENQAAYQAIKEIGVEEFAIQISKSERTIRSEIVPTKSPDSAHKLSFDDALAAMFISGDITPLVIFLDRLDYIVVPAEHNSEIDSRERMSLRVLSAAGRFSQLLSEALADGRISDAEWKDCVELLKTLEREAAAATRNGAAEAINAE